MLQVVPLNGKEWGATIAIGLGAWPVSWITRAVSKLIEMRLANQAALTAAERNSGTGSGLAGSGRAQSSKTNPTLLPRASSGRGSMRIKIMQK